MKGVLLALALGGAPARERGLHAARLGAGLAMPPYLLPDRLPGGHQHHPRRQPEPDQRLHRPVLDRARGLHGDRRLRVGVLHGHLRRPAPARRVGFLPAFGRESARAPGRARRSARCSPPSPGSWSACRRCACAGDYLAIVTLGFGEIIRVIIQNIDAVGGARGFAGIPKLANFFWIYGFAALTVLVVYRIVALLVRARRSWRSARTRSRPRRWASHTTRAKVISFVVSSAMAGVGGRALRPLPHVHPPRSRSRS